MIASRAIVPGLERIALVGDAVDGRSVWRHVIDEIPVAAAGVEVIDLLGMPMMDLRQRVAVLPARTAILYLGIYSDSAGTGFPPVDAIARVAEVANRPIVIASETSLGRGGVGGFVVRPSAIGAEAAQLALRVLDGESAASIPIAVGGAIRPMFDWRQLQRWA